MITTEFVLQILVVGMWCWGFYNAFRDGEILGGPGKLMRKTLPEWLSKPTFDCPICQASIHGTIWFLIFNEWSFIPWILFIVSVSGFNYCLAKMQYE